MQSLSDKISRIS